MHLALGRKEAYSIEIVMHLAESPAGVRVKAREIAAAAHVPVHYVGQVLADLVRAHILTAKAGRSGGYELARPASAITLLEVIEATGATVADETGEPRAPGDEPGTRHRFAVEQQWSGVRSLLSDELRRICISDLTSAVRLLASAASGPPNGSPRA